MRFLEPFSREMQTLINVSVSLGIYVVVKSLNEEMTIYSIGSLLLAPSMNKAIQFRKIKSTGFQIHPETF